MLAICPKNSNHVKFFTIAHVVEEWKVDKNGHYIDTVECLETAQEPCIENIWTCAVCGTEAIVTND